jgi:DNA anti-recombination protein RmuC
MDNQSELIQAVQQGLAQVVKAIDGTNQRLDSAVDKIDQRFEKIDQRFDDLTAEVREFKTDVSRKLDGIGTYLQKIDAQVINNHAGRIYELERRVDDIEKKFGT